jgi:hypothetical protein
VEAVKVEPGSPVTFRKYNNLQVKRRSSTLCQETLMVHSTLRDAQEYVEAPKSTFRESKPMKKFPDYMALMSSIIDFKPSSFQKEIDHTGMAACHGGGTPPS